jgi:hypothetical protein
MMLAWPAADLTQYGKQDNAGQQQQQHNARLATVNALLNTVEACYVLVGFNSVG